FARALRELGLPREQYRLAVKGWLPETGLATVASLTTQAEAYLRRQRTDHVEYMVLGDLLTEIDDFTDVLTELGALIASGKIGHWAVNNWSAAEIGRAQSQAQELG